MEGEGGGGRLKAKGYRLKAGRSRKVKRYKVESIKGGNAVLTSLTFESMGNFKNGGYA